MDINNVAKPNLPKYLYKYFSMKSKENIGCIFTRNKLWFSNPHYFNDPFDCKPLLTFERDWNQKQFIRYHLNLAKDSFKRDLIYVEEKEHRSIATRLYAFYKNDPISKKSYTKRINKIIEDGLEETIDEFRILCLSKVNNNMLMWAHYADGHKGFAIQFETESLINNFNRKPEKALYIKRKSFPSIKDFNDYHQMQMFLLAKSSQWKYEDEYRILKHGIPEKERKRKGKNYKFKDGLITGIIFGYKMEDTDKKTIFKWIDDYKPHIKRYDANKDENSYKMRISPATE